MARRYMQLLHAYPETLEKVLELDPRFTYSFPAVTPVIGQPTYNLVDVYHALPQDQLQAAATPELWQMYLDAVTLPRKLAVALLILIFATEAQRGLC
jgi:hypothetical protein